MGTPKVGDNNAATGIGADAPARSSRSSKRTRNMVVIGVLVAVLGGGAAIAGVMASGDRAGTSTSYGDFMYECEDDGHSERVCRSLWRSLKGTSTSYGDFMYECEDDGHSERVCRSLWRSLNW
jgi:hypothetical protein